MDILIQGTFTQRWNRFHETQRGSVDRSIEEHVAVNWAVSHTQIHVNGMVD